jgi:hypothetical protein
MKSQSRILLDRKQLLGFKLDAEGGSAAKHGAKVGGKTVGPAKLGAKLGGKPVQAIR